VEAKDDPFDMVERIEVAICTERVEAKILLS